MEATTIFLVTFFSLIADFIIIAAIAVKICWSGTRATGKEKRGKSSKTRIPKASSRQTSIAIPLDESLPITMNDILASTNNFSAAKISGYTRFGSVYNAELSNGLKLAVKKLDPDALQGFVEFTSELEILGRRRHRNVVQILGYCISGENRLLIYESFGKCNLEICLHDFSGLDDSFASSLLLSWETRHKIIRGVTNGLAYMRNLDKPI